MAYQPRPATLVWRVIKHMQQAQTGTRFNAQALAARHSVSLPSLHSSLRKAVYREWLQADNLYGITDYQLGPACMPLPDCAETPIDQPVHAVATPACSSVFNYATHASATSHAQQTPRRMN